MSNVHKFQPRKPGDKTRGAAGAPPKGPSSGRPEASTPGRPGAARRVDPTGRPGPAKRPDPAQRNAAVVMIGIGLIIGISLLAGNLAP
ncbi:hypothetical protein ASG43_09575 [Aureimonas sp. Leaf454]|uniref:hypothetical protein n=1 Tax=Aureimonas sp. Leaf454 TaxID=1736381 RepID=UPI0006F34AC2|nr:hypothetical protein [Aureimonas sp. Leaf454]KQT47368.1 hypothetical protein ASG43_09575 [Aureimonas sp. Leaf454]